MNATFRIFLTFLWRDTYLYWQKAGTYFINYSIIYPILYGFTFAYLQANLYFGFGNTTVGTVIFVGNMLLIMVNLTSKVMLELLFDMENTRFIEYQLSLLPPRLVLLERVVFTSLFTFVGMIPFLPIAKLALQDRLITTNTNWLMFALMLYVGSLFCSSYYLLVSCLLPNTTYLSSLWARVNQPLIALGGLWIPLATISQFSPVLGTINMANPLIYITEGLRQSVIGGPTFLPLTTCIFTLLGFTTVCTLLSFYFFKKRTDHI